MEISKNIFYVGVNDYDIDLFEGQYKVENGMSYNSYVIVDRKIAVMDTVDKHFGKKWLENLENARLSRNSSYGARSFGEYREFYRKISAGESGFRPRGVCHDEKLLR